MCVCAHTRTHMWVWLWVCMHVCVYIIIYTGVRMYMYVCQTGIVHQRNAKSTDYVHNWQKQLKWIVNVSITLTTSNISLLYTLHRCPWGAARTSGRGDEAPALRTLTCGRANHVPWNKCTCEAAPSEGHLHLPRHQRPVPRRYSVRISCPCFSVILRV